MLGLLIILGFFEEEARELLLLYKLAEWVPDVAKLMVRPQSQLLFRWFNLMFLLPTSGPKLLSNFYSVWQGFLVRNNETISG